MVGNNLLTQTIFPPDQVELLTVTPIIDELTVIRDMWNLLFQERDHLVMQTLLALMMAEHICMEGEPGTAKSYYVNAVTASIDGAKIWENTLGEYTAIEDLFGIPHPKIIENEGLIKYQPAGSILVGDIVFLDEFADARPQFLRGRMLPFMMNRVFQNGEQILKASLHTLFAATNKNIQDEITRNDALKAVFDRFLFTCVVNSLDSKENRKLMVWNYATGMTSSTMIDFVKVQKLTSLIRQTNMLTEMSLIDTYVEVVDKWKAWVTKRGYYFSDRSYAVMSQLLEAACMLDGRLLVEPKDLDALRWTLCQGNNAEHHEAFDKVCVPIIKKAVEATMDDIDVMHAKLLDEWGGKIPNVDGRRKYSKEELVDLARELTSLQTQIAGIKPKGDNKSTQTRLLAVIEKNSEKVQQMILKG